MMQKVADHVNNYIHKAKNKQKLMDISSGGANSLLRAHRHLVLDGEFKCENRKRPTMFYVFNDILVHLSATKAKHKQNLTLPESQWPLRLIWVESPAPDLIKILGPTEDYYILKRTNDATRLVESLKKAIDEDLKQQSIQKHNSPDSPPTWESDDRVGTYQFPNSVLYRGAWHRGEMHGEGTWRFLDHEYTGTFVHGCKEGEGEMRYFSGNVYRGAWKNDLPEGRGLLTYPSGDQYEGEFHRGAKEGAGIMRFANGDAFDGYWKDNRPEGMGTFNYHTGIVYVGTFKNGRYHQNGVLSSHKTGMKYEGEWKNGLRDGEGCMTYPDESTYNGHWEGGMRHGTGSFQCKREGQYQGEWVHDLKEGHGTMEFLSGNVYSGTWRANQFHGTGKIIYSTGTIQLYEGEWVENRKCGRGVMYYTNGDSFEGFFKDDLMNGSGVFTYSNGLVLSGKWTNGVLDGKTNVSTLYNVDASAQTNISGLLKDNIWVASERLPALHFHPLPDLHYDF